MDALKQTPLNALHHELGAKMVSFAGYEMPVQYPMGVMKEHLHTRNAAGLFDVSHMGQLRLYGDVADALERLIPQNVAELANGRQRYGFLTNAKGGIMDDLMFANQGDHIYMVVNAACKDEDITHLQTHLGDQLEVVEDRALIALQGPKADAVLGKLAPQVADMCFMDIRTVEIIGAEAWVSRSGYTGEDGFEISIPSANAEELARLLLADEVVEPIGLGARDSLRLEAGLCLYGHDIDSTTTPVEADLVWAMQKRRREQGGFEGAAVIQTQLSEGVARKRVGLAPQSRAPMREGTKIYANAEGGAPIGHVTSGGFGPSVGAPVAMGYVESEFAKPGTELFGEVRNKRHGVVVATLPFVPANFKR